MRVHQAVRPVLDALGGPCLVAVPPPVPDHVWQRDADATLTHLLGDEHSVVVAPDLGAAWRPVASVSAWAPDGVADAPVRLVVVRPPGMGDAVWQVYERLVLDGLGHDEALETAELLAD